MNIKNYFNVKLYLQAIKRLKVVGIISAIFLSIYAFIVPIISYPVIEETYYMEEINLLLDSEPYVLEFVEEAQAYGYIDASSSSFCGLYMVLYIIVPIMSVIIFHFMTTRNGSDFYHSLPTKRRAVYLSFIGAIATWSLILIAIFSIVMSIAYAVIPHTVINPLNILIFTLNIFISCILMAAGFGLGCCLSGTVLSNIVTSLSILFLPRLFITLFCAAISVNNPLVSFDGMSILSRYDCNMLFAGIAEPFVYILDYNSIAFDSLSQINFSTLYTLILAIIYIIFGCIVYTKRPSETAGKPAVTSKLQHMLRLILGYTISLFVIIPIYNYVELFKPNEYNFQIYRGMDWYTELGGPVYIFFIYLITFIAMFLYELITTKAAKKAIKSLITAPLIIIANIVTIVILCQINYSIFFYQPKAEDIDYVKFHIDNDTYIDTVIDMAKVKNYDKHYDNPETIIEHLNNLKVDDKKILELVSELMESSINRTRKYYYTGTYFADYYYDDHFEQYDKTIAITICDGIFETERYLFVTDSELETIIKYLLEYEETKEIYESYPDAYENYVFIRPLSGLTETQTKEVYNAFINDLKCISPFEYVASLSDYNEVCTLFVDYYNNGELYSDILDVTYATPTATSLYIKYHKENSNMTFDTLYDKLNATDTSYYGALTLTISDYAEHSFSRHHINVQPHEDSSKLFDMIKATSDIVEKYEYFPEDISNIDWNKYYFCCISVYYYQHHSSKNTEFEKGEFLYYFLFDKSYLEQDFLNSFDKTLYGNY